MFNPKELTAAQRTAIIQTMRDIKNNPIALARIAAGKQVLILKDHSRNLSPELRKAYLALIEVHQQRIEQIFTDLEAKILQTASQQSFARDLYDGKS